MLSYCDLRTPTRGRPATGFYVFCNANGQGYSGPSGARAYIQCLISERYYAVPLAPEATFALAGRARDFLGVCPTFKEWMTTYYPNYHPSGPDVMPAAYGWVSFYGEAKSPQYQAWRDEHGL